MAKIRTRKHPSNQSSIKLHKGQQTLEASAQTKIVMKCENIEIQDTITELGGEPKNCEKHLHLVEKDLLEFTNSLSKTIGSRRKNVLSALIVTADITIPAPEELEQAHSGPVHACLCELKGKDEGIVVICQKNCCCLIFLDTCHCGFELPANPSKSKNIKEATFVGKNYGDDSNATGINSSDNECSASTGPKLRKNLSQGSIKQNARRCSHGTHRKKTSANRESCSQPSETRLATRTASAHPHRAQNTWCRVVELTEREHLILSRAEKSQKSITKLSRSTRKNHGVQIFLMKQLAEVHIRGKNYHQGLKELLKEIQRATKWWESHRSATHSDNKCSKETTNGHDSRVTGIVKDGLTSVNKDSPSRTPTMSGPAEGVFNLAKSRFAISSFKNKVEHSDIKSSAVKQSLFLPVRRAKNDAMQKIRDSLRSHPGGLKQTVRLRLPPFLLRRPQTAIRTGGPPVLKPQTARRAVGPPLQKLQTARRTGGPPVLKPQTTRPAHFWLQGPGEVCRRLVATHGSRRTMLHKITLCPKKHTELLSTPELAEKVDKLQKYFLLQGSRIDFKVWLSSSKAVLVLVCGAEDFSRSYDAVLDQAARMGIRRYFPNLFGDEFDEGLDAATKREQVHSPSLAENSRASKVTQEVEKTGTALEPTKTETASFPLANTAIKADRTEIFPSSSTTGGSPLEAKREPYKEISVQPTEPQQVQSKEFMPKPGPPSRPPQRSHVPLVEFSPQFLHTSSVRAPNGGSPYYDYNGHPITPMTQPNSGPIPTIGFHPNFSPPVQQFPLWNNFNHAPNNPTFAHSALPFQFLGGQNFYHLFGP